MSESLIASLKTHFGDLSAPRVQQSLDHLLLAIVLLTICAVICGAERWVEFEPDRSAKQA
ncbi:MAG: transposase family protein [Verrucomicrobia bacterium]|nr:transposase family protein [Leptolyngbya sp. ES-bin-22]